jgi:aminopeptidase N
MRPSLLLAATFLASTAHAEAPFAFDSTPGKLPKTVVPSAYRIEVTPDLQKLTLAGHETIDIEVRKPTARIVLNQAGLVLRSATLEDGAAARIKLDEKLQEASLTFAKPVTNGRHTLTIAYSGPIPESPAGIYYDDYRTPSGAKKRMLVTQFEVADARRMFPGWDEPAFKATFQLSVNLPADLAVVSNMPPEKRTTTADGMQHVVFGTSPRMSTYLLALLAGDMEAVRGHAGATQLAAWAPAGEAEQARYALDVEAATLPYYNEYFGTAYPLPKLDLIAVPGNYEAGAMENWGAITFIDDAMLFDPKTSSPGTREEIPLVVNHEMAHQWSGDLVTMGWWSNIWLNEGFATWMELKATDHFNPAWQIWPRQHDARESAMAQDALPTTHPIQQPIHDESEANTAFDRISYQKGSQIIRMVEDWIGPDVFRDGMRAYMKAHSYSNSTSADLWAALGAASHKDVARVAATFTEQPGIPLVHVASACAGGHRTLTLTQDRFTIHDPHPKALTWNIPVTIGMQGGQTTRVLLGAKPLVLSAGSCDGWVKANWGENGYYRTQYDARSLTALAHALPTLSPADRANVLGDTFALFAANRVPLQAYLDLLNADRDEQNIAVWTDTLSHLDTLDQALDGSPAQARLRAYAAALIRPEAARLGWDAKPGELFLDALLRPHLISALGRADDPATLAEARRRFSAFVQNPASLAPALRAPVLDMVGHTADQATWDTLKRLGVAATGTEEKLRYFRAMAMAQDPKLIAQNVTFADTGEIPNGRITSFLQDASEGSGHAALVYADVKPVEAKLAARAPEDGLGPTPLVAAASGASDPAIAKAVLAAPSSNSSIGARIWAARAADGIGTRAELRGRVLAQFKG